MESSTPDIDTEWQSWKASGDPKKLRQIVTQLHPTIEKTLASYRIKSPVVFDRAKLVAAKAVQTFDPTKGAKLPTYVSSQLRSIARDAPQIQEPMVPGQKYREEMASIYKANQGFSSTFGRDATDEEISEVSSIPLRKVIRLRSASRARIPMSVVEEHETDDDADYDVVGSVRTKQDDWVDAVYAGLGDIDRLILMHRTGYRNAQILDNDELAKRVGLSPETVHRRALHIQNQLDQFRENPA